MRMLSCPRYKRRLKNYLRAKDRCAKCVGTSVTLTIDFTANLPSTVSRSEIELLVDFKLENQILLLAVDTLYSIGIKCPRSIRELHHGLGALNDNVSAISRKVSASRGNRAVIARRKIGDSTKRSARAEKKLRRNGREATRPERTRELAAPFLPSESTGAAKGNTLYMPTTFPKCSVQFFAATSAAGSL